MSRTTLSIVLVGLLCSASGCADQMVAGFFTDVMAALSPTVEVVGGDNDAICYTVDRAGTGSKDLYRYDLATNQKQLLRSIPSNLLSPVAVDGRYVAFTQGQSNLIPGVGSLLGNSLVVSDLETANEWVLFEGEGDPLENEGPHDTVVDVAVAGDRVAYKVSHWVYGDPVDWVFVEDLTGREPVRQFEAGLIHELHLRGDYLAYAASDDSPTRIMLHDLSTDEAVTVAEDVSRDIDTVYIELTPDAVVWAVEHWSDGGQAGLSEVYLYDIRTRETQLWAERAPGTLHGATREYFLTVEGLFGFLFASPEPITIRRFDWEGNAVVLDESPFTVGAGNAQVIGDWAVWTNERWQIVLEPLAGGERRFIDPS